MGSLLLLGLLIFTTVSCIKEEEDNPENGHDENCVDVSIFGPVEFEEENTEVCSYKLKRICTEKSTEICMDVPATNCEVFAYTDCDTKETTEQVRDDSIEVSEFIKQSCVVSSMKEQLTEVKRIPVCRNVTRQLCITKWVVDDTGEKIWAGNDDCEDVVWEDCTLEDALLTQDVDVWDCSPDTEPVFYQTPSTKQSSTVSQSRVCEAKAHPMCSHTTQELCETVEWSDCHDEIVPTCFTVTLRTPFQQYHHRQHCSIIDHD